MSAGLGSIVLRVYSVVVLVLVFVASRKNGGRLQRASIWLALLNLAALQSPGAWGDYITLGTVWLLSLFTWQTYRGTIRIVFLVACWIFSFTVIGNQPMPELLPVPVMMVLTTLSALLMLAVNTWALFGLESETTGGYAQMQSEVRGPKSEVRELGLSSEAQLSTTNNQ